MATARFPFEIADYEGDVATGPYSDYGGVFLVLSFAGGTYYATFSYSFLASLLFLGGWNLPGFAVGSWPQDILGHLVLAAWVMFKTLVLMLFFAFLRAAMSPPALDALKQLGVVPLLFFALGPFTKSAQFPFHEWLLTAMTGPTSVSALIHAATMPRVAA